jgi:predicted metalloprotease with PDZ domain
VERIRPADIEPFNFEKSNMSCCLWLAEGFTQYYGDLILTRAGLIPDAANLWMSARMVTTKNSTPGAMYYNPVDASHHAPFVDAAVSIDQTNYGNMHTSYYSYGAAIAFALDLEMLGRFGKSLDAFMQELWKRFGKPEKGYTLSSLQEALSTVSNNGFATNFFNKYIIGHETYDYGSALAKLGYDLINSSAGKPFTGITTEAIQGRGSSLPAASNTITQPTRRNTPAYKAGLDVGDEIVTINSQPVKSAADLAGISNKAKPGDTWVVEYKQRGKTKQTTLTVEELYTPNIVPYEQAGKIPDQSMLHLRKQWRGGN